LHITYAKNTQTLHSTDRIRSQQQKKRTPKEKKTTQCEPPESLQEEEKTSETKNKEDSDKEKSKKKRGKKKKELDARNAPGSLPPSKTLCCRREHNAPILSLGTTSLLQA
jgi:hypothetical protein